MVRASLFLAAVTVLYWGGFIYDEVGPGFYAVILAIIAATPLLLKLSFWKKILLMVPLLLLRVIGKILLTVFGKNAFSKLLAKYGLLEARFNNMLASLTQNKNLLIDRWKNTHRSTQAYLLLIFFPLLVVLLLLLLVIEFIRLRFVQMIIEKAMQSVLLRWTRAGKSKIVETKIVQTKFTNAQPDKSSLVTRLFAALFSEDDNVEQPSQGQATSKQKQSEFNALNDDRVNDQNAPDDQK